MSLKFSDISSYTYLQFYKIQKYIDTRIDVSKFTYTEYIVVNFVTYQTSVTKIMPI